jgi:hypothetical protein
MNTLVYNMARSGFITMPYPEKDCSGSVVVVTGANSGNIKKQPSLSGRY